MKSSIQTVRIKQRASPLKSMTKSHYRFNPLLTPHPQLGSKTPRPPYRSHLYVYQDCDIKIRVLTSRNSPSQSQHQPKAQCPPAPQGANPDIDKKPCTKQNNIKLANNLRTSTALSTPFLTMVPNPPSLSRLLHMSPRPIHYARRSAELLHFRPLYARGSAARRQGSSISMQGSTPCLLEYTFSHIEIKMKDASYRTEGV